MINEQKLLSDIMKKASDNGEGQAYIKPSEYGFSRLSEGTEACRDYLLGLDIVREVKQDGKDHLDILVKK